ncbi:MAG: class IV adenylate cyclase [Rubrivivax sp.]
MPRNIEIKARIASVDALLPRAQALAGGAPPALIEQDDQFFRVPYGRLKLRRFADGSAELIQYQRPDGTAARASDYVRVPVPDADALAQALGRALGAAGRVVKRRWLLLAGQTRIHLDRVQSLGDFMELEVVLRDGQPDAEGQAIAERLMQDLGLAQAPRLAGAYVDLGAGGAQHSFIE